MTDSPLQAPTDSVAWYYNQNTARFLRFGGSRKTAALHRQIWTPGVENTAQAFLYLNQYIAQAIAPTFLAEEGETCVIDLGCGVGGTSTWLAQQTGAMVVGITNSDVQLRLATERASQLGLAERCRFLQADFMNLPAVAPARAAFAIESFIHAREAERFFTQIAAHIIAGGRLVICDDFLAEETRSLPASHTAQKWIRRFESGWQLNSLVTLSTAQALAERAGFHLVKMDDLTPYLRLFHPLLLDVMKWVTRLPVRSAYWYNLSGGAALQICLQHRWTRYCAVVWEKKS